MATIAVVYGRNDEEAAEILKNEIEDQSQYQAFTIDGWNTSSIQESDFAGILAVGGRNSNEIYEEYYNRFNWEAPGTGIMDNRAVFNGINTVEDTPVAGIAGYTESDTLEAVKTWTGRTQSGVTVISYAGIDEYINHVNEHQGNDREIDDPNDPVLDPDDPDDGPTGNKKLVVEARGLSWPGSIGYTLQVSKFISSEDLDGSTRIHNRVSSVTEKVGGNYRDEYRFSGEITDIEADKDLRIFVDGQRKIYDSTADKIIEPGNDDEEPNLIERLLGLENASVFEKLLIYTLSSIFGVAAMYGLKTLSELAGIINR